MKKSFLVIIIGIFNLLASLSFMIESFSVEDKGYGTKYSFNIIYIIWVISSILICALGYIMHKEEKTKNQA